MYAACMHHVPETVGSSQDRERKMNLRSEKEGLREGYIYEERVKTWGRHDGSLGWVQLVLCQRESRTYMLHNSWE